jgi:hypothetical protein
MMIQPVNDSPDLTVLERSVLETVFLTTRLADDFRQQIDAATVAVRTPSGVGFMSKLHVPDEYRAADIVENTIPLVIGAHPELPSGAEFVVQVKDGRINCIEAFCHEGMWPADESQFNIHLGP